MENLLTNKWLGIPIFALVMFLVFDISQATLGPWIADTLVGWIESFQGWVAELVSNASPFVPCGAKLPVIALFAGVFFAEATWIGTLMYFVGIFLIFAGALLVNKVTGYKYKKSFFIMELPEYKFPSIKRGFFSMLERGKSYIVKAGTIILVCNTVVQIMQSFNWQLQLVEEGMEGTSILAGIAAPIAVLLIPLGFIAKENGSGQVLDYSLQQAM